MNENTNTKKEEMRELAEVISKVKRNSADPNYERIFMLGIIRGIEIKGDIETVKPILRAGAKGG